MMALNHTDRFSAEYSELAAFAGAMAHPARIAIINLLQEKGAASCGEIVAMLPLAQATISQHLQVLVKVGLLQRQNKGPKTCYSINCDALRSFCHNFQCTLGTVEQENNTEQSK
ncbi:ArsR/SmtB family transcription factor [Coraliomargarita parva]|uniref:ArsR/SmtB family transcription factor n=1 Tax=Coraliomargarita parva TaxID=3014050 RepID=UPI0022B5CB70|nr:metalloregulator ArsR/SmtB family transcription factor [Coraliomargarita parva]